MLERRRSGWGGVLAAVLLVVALLGLRSILRSRYAAAHPRYEAAVQLIEGALIDPENVDAVGVILPGQETELRYRRDERGWRLMRYRDAWARSDAIEGLVSSIVSGIAIPVGAGRSDKSLGFPSSLPRIRLYAGERLLVETLYGGVLPSWDARNGLYARRAGEDQIWHLSTVPPLYLGSRADGPAPLLDTRVLPRALTPSGSLVRVRFDPPGSHELDLLERRDLSDEERDAESVGADAPHYAWWGRSAGGERRMVTETADAYVRFVSALSFRSIPRPSSLPEAVMRPTERRIVLEFEERLPADSEGVQPEVERIWLELRATAPSGEGLVFCSATDFLTELAAPKAGLLFPAAAVLEAEYPRGGTPFGLGVDL